MLQSGKPDNGKLLIPTCCDARACRLCGVRVEDGNWLR
ncbi:hypothetical protein D1Y85_22540 [Paraburkholderia dinghuensis]|uniref:Uncharacterized protein n=1 Tax=Paraburkholderia dinghuensis TaxID=2305225 RepID=A0A3N6PRJ1_9BURK|nr:hypothetical protein D1Y85_22540 [Paraburkholderia dinghuensis]